MLESLGGLSAELQNAADDGTADDYQPHAHKGFLAYFLTIEPGISEALGKVAADGRQRRLWIAGHSMGGAVSFAAAYIYTAYRETLLRHQPYAWLNSYNLSGGWHGWVGEQARMQLDGRRRARNSCWTAAVRTPCCSGSLACQCAGNGPPSVGCACSCRWL